MIPQLIDASTAEHVWADVLDEDLTEIFAAQTNIAARVVEALGIALGAPELEALERVPTDNLEAHDLYLRAQEYSRRNMSQQDARTAVQMFEEAVELDPDFAEAWGRLAEEWTFLYWQHGDVDALPLAREALERAQQLGPDLTTTRVASAKLHYYGARDFDRALEELASVHEREPNNARVLDVIGFVSRRLGRWDESVEYTMKAVELSPASYQGYSQVALTFTYMRDYAEAELLLTRAISLDPERALYYRWLAGVYLKWDGQLDKAERTIQQMLNRSEDVSVRGLLARVFATQWSDWLGERPLPLLAQAEVARQLNQHEIARSYYDSAMTLYSAPRYFEGT